ncbi:MAG: hypothetical protein E7316_02970 [Clostridiales bacterium]|nr:hypothetical protein [Clostridiales bacterium]
MRSFFRRAVCALLCLFLLVPSLAFAGADVSGIQFDLQFEMDPSAFPPEQQKVITGIADLVNITTLQGTLDQSYTGCFDLNAQLMLDGQEDTRTSLRVYGTESCWGVESSLLGNEMLTVHLNSMLEFAMKAYYHMEIPVQRAAIFISPYVHTSAFEALSSAWRSVMHAQEGERTIPREQVMALAGELADIAANDRALRVWTQAIALEAGYNEDIMDALTSLPEWAESFVGPEGIQITVMGATETWRTGEITLFTRTVEDTVTAWSATLPVTTNGYELSVFYNGQPNGEHTLRVNITDEYEDCVLDCTVKAENIPDLTCEVPISAPFSLSLDMAGSFLEEDMRLRFRGEGENGFFTLSKLNAQTGAPQLTLSGTLNPYTPQATPDFSMAQLTKGQNLLAINDEGLTRLVTSVAPSLVDGAIPLLVHMPASSVQSFLDLMTDSGLIDFVVNGGASMYEEDYGEEYYEEDYGDGEYYEEEYYD